jgi:hypothetical protein
MAAIVVVVVVVGVVPRTPTTTTTTTTTVVGPRVGPFPTLDVVSTLATAAVVRV